MQCKMRNAEGAKHRLVWNQDSVRVKTAPYRAHFAHALFSRVWLEGQERLATHGVSTSKQLVHLSRASCLSHAHSLGSDFPPFPLASAQSSLSTLSFSQRRTTTSRSTERRTVWSILRLKSSYSAWSRGEPTSSKSTSGTLHAF